MKDRKKYSKLTAAALVLATSFTFAISPGLAAADDHGRGPDQQDYRQGGGRGPGQGGGPQAGPQQPQARQQQPQARQQQPQARQQQPQAGPQARQQSGARDDGRHSGPAAKAPATYPAAKAPAGAKRSAPVTASPRRTYPAPAVRYRGPVYTGHFPSLPRDHARVHVRGEDFYYYNGYFHRHDPNGYIIVNAPLGAVVFSLPIGYRTAVVAGITYFILNDIWYRSVASGYEVVAPPADVPVAETESDRGILPGDMVRVAVAKLNVRTGPGFEYPVVEVIVYNSLVEIQSGTNGWLFIRLTDGKAGWIMERFVTLEDAGASG